MKKNETHRVAGQTILELVVALGIVALVLTGLIAGVSSSLRFSQNSSFRSLAVKHAQEGIEYVRKLRDTSEWSAFLSYSGSGVSYWCVTSTGIWSSDDGNGCQIAAGSPFYRSITFRWDDPIMAITSQISWGERVAPSIVTFDTYFTQWK